MIVITHKIELTDLQLTQKFASIPIDDGIKRWELILPIDRSKFDDGASLTNSLQPVAWCNIGRDLRWYNVTNSEVNLDMDLWNKDTVQTVPFNGFLPYKEMVV